MVTTPEGTKERPGRIYAPRRAGRSWRRNPYFRNPYLAKRHGPSLREVVIFLLLMLVLLAMDGIYVITSIQTPLRETARYLDEGAAALQKGDVPAARTAFVNAVRESREAESLSARPSMFLASHSPWLSRDADAIRALTRSARLFAVAGTSAADAVEALGGTSRDQIAEALYDNGQLQFDTIDQAQGALATVADNLAEAREVLENAPRPRIQRLADAVETARDRVTEVQPRAAAAARLLDAVPRMMGRDEPRTYFVALQSQSEARATGGSIGLYGVMEADRGRIRLTHVGPSFELGENPKQPLTSGILLPAWYAERYGDVVDLGNVNRSPHFPLAARAILQMYRNATGRTLDGVWSFDPVAFQDITAATGPLSGPGYNVTIGPDNASEVLLKDVYLHFGVQSVAQVQFLIGVTQDFYDRLGGQADTGQLFESLADAAGSNHFKVYSTVADEQQTLVDLGLDGGLHLDEAASQMVFHNNLEGNKVDYFLRRTIDTTIRLTSDGGAAVTTTVKLDNQAAPGPPSVLLGFPERGERPGFNQMELNFLLPRGATDVEGELDGQATSLTLGLEGSFPLAALEVGIPPESSREVIITYNIQKVQTFLESARDFRFVLAPQPTAIPDRYIVTLVAPDGYALLRGGPNSGKQLRGSLEFTGELDVPITIHASVVRR